MAKAGSDEGVRKPGDKSYNARRREYRAAQRYLDKANQSTGEVAEKNRSLARQHLFNALDTYDPTAPNQNISSQIINIGAALGIDVQGARSELIPKLSKDATAQQRKRAIERQKEAVQASTQALETTLQENRRELEAQELMGTGSPIAKRVMGGLVDIWREKVSTGKSAEENRAAAQKAIFDKFKVSSWADVLEKLEHAIGSELYLIAGDLEIYDTVRIAIQKGVTGNTLVQ